MTENAPAPGAPGAWNPSQYGRFRDHRSRPFHDLLAQVPTEAPRLVVDLGCGPGGLTLELARRWPQARVVGVDNSEEMLDAARLADADGRVEWVAGNAETLDLGAFGEPVDVLLTNATLQWVPTHLRLIPGWLDALAPGGAFAMQVPDNFDAPSHAQMRAAARRHRRASELVPALSRELAVAAPQTYTALLLDHPRVQAVDTWSTTYQHVLPAPEGREHPVLSWVRGTGLRPVLARLEDPAELEEFLLDYRERLAQAYPVSRGRVVFPFARIFAVASIAV